MEYKDLHTFLDESLKFQKIQGTKDTSSWMVLRVYNFNQVEQDQFNIDFLLIWQFNTALQANLSATLLTKNSRTLRSVGAIGYIDLKTDYGNGLDYSRFHVFFRGPKVAVLEFHHRGDLTEFLEIANPITASLDN